MLITKLATSLTLKKKVLLFIKFIHTYIEEINFEKMRQTRKNTKVVDIREQDESRLINWKDECFSKIQAIQQNPDSKNHEAFYRKIIEIIEELKGSSSLITDNKEYFKSDKSYYNINRELKIFNFKLVSLKLIVLIVKIVNEEKTKKTLQIINARSAAFITIQDLILDLTPEAQHK